MDNQEVIAALSALAQPTRLDTFRLLVSREPEGVAAGELARLMAIPQNTMSTHLAILARAGLVRGERHSRSIIYRADLERFREVTLFLLKDCCGGRPERVRAADRRSHALLSTWGGRSWLIAFSTSCFSARATPRARSSPKASCARTARGASAPSRREAIRRGESIRSLSKCSKASIIRPRACARKVGKNLQRPARRKWISCSRSATTRRAKPVRFGRVSR